MEITYNNKKYIIGELVEPNPGQKLELFDIITIFEVEEEDEHGIICPILKPIDYFYKDRDDIVQLAKERIDYIQRTRTPTTQYRDTFVTLFHDEEKMALVFLNDRGKTKSISYDDNFFYVESLVEEYYEMLLDSFQHWRTKELCDDDLDEMRIYLSGFYLWLNKEQQEEPLDFEVLSEEVQQLLKGEIE